MRSLLLGKVGKGTSCNLQAFELSVNLSADLRDEAVPYLAYIIKLPVFIVADDQRIKRMAGRVPANNKFLPLVDPVFEPSAGALPGLVNGIFSFRDDAFKGTKDSLAVRERVRDGNWQAGNSDCEPIKAISALCC